MASKTYDRDTNLSNEGPTKVNEQQISSLISKNLADPQALRLLHEKYGDTKMVEKVFDAYKERKDLIAKKARKFKELLSSKYFNLSLPALIEKAKKYKVKYQLTDDEFNAFINLALSDKTYASNMYNQPTTPMSKALGYSSTEITYGKMQVPTNELDVLQDILRMQAESSILYEQIKLQSLTYVDCALQAITGKYDKNRQNSFSYINPVIAALFLPRIKYIDEHMLLASISNIVYNRYNGIPIRTQPDYELYWDLITDPNEIVCVSNNESSLIDLKNRVKLQIELWKLVRELREGRYYSDESRTFNLAIDSCKTGLFDVPDMANMRDEGTVLRKLFGAFSLRPTIVTISSLSSGLMTGNWNLGPMALSQVTTIPIVNLRLPFNYKNKMSTVYLNEALEQPEWFVENKMIVPKVKSIIYSRDIIVFYAPRRYQTVNFSRITAPYNFTVLPPTHSSLETINDININYESTIVVGNERFFLRSVVFIEKSLTNKDLIIGSSTGIVVRRDYELGRTQPTYLLYNPQAAIIEFEDEQGTYVHNPPIVEIPATTSLYSNNDLESFQRRVCSRGTIFVYVKDQPQYTSLKPC